MDGRGTRAAGFPPSETFEQLGGMVVWGCATLGDPQSIPLASDGEPASREKEKMNFAHKVHHQHNTQLRLGIRPPNPLLQAAWSMHHPQLRLNIQTTRPHDAGCTPSTSTTSPPRSFPIHDTVPACTHNCASECRTPSLPTPSQALSTRCDDAANAAIPANDAHPDSASSPHPDPQHSSSHDRQTPAADAPAPPPT